MLQSKQRLLELNAKLAETLTDKGVTATADETTTALVNKVTGIKNGDDSTLRGLIQRDLTDLIIPYGVTSIGNGAFRSCTSLTNVTIPNSVTSIGTDAFNGCTRLTNVTIPNSVKNIGNGAFNGCTRLTGITIPNGVISIGANTFTGCTSLTNVTIPNSVKIIGNYAFLSCTSLTNVTIPNSVTSISSNAFQYCSAMENFIVEVGFNTSINIKYSTKFSRETLRAIIDNYADRTGQSTLTLTIGSENLVKLTEEEILIATNKNITLA